MNNNELVIVDTEHGGLDSEDAGKVSEEKDLTLQAATYSYARFQELGYTR